MASASVHGLRSSQRAGSGGGVAALEGRLGWFQCSPSDEQRHLSLNIAVSLSTPNRQGQPKAESTAMNDIMAHLVTTSPSRP